eukprot:Lankesteria_metandrocarpae@DN5376_c0_g1_i5.p1
MMLKGSLCGLLACVAYAQIAVYNMGSFDGKTKMVMSGDPAQRHRAFLNLRQCSMLNKVGEMYRRNEVVIKQASLKIKGYTLKQLAEDLRIPLRRLEALPKFSTAVNNENLNRMNTNNFEDVFVNPDGTHFGVDWNKRVQDSFQLSSWDYNWITFASWPLYKGNELGTMVSALALLQFIDLTHQLKLYLQHCSPKLTRYIDERRGDLRGIDRPIDLRGHSSPEVSIPRKDSLGISHEVHDHLKKFPLVKAYHKRTQGYMFYNLQLVDSYFYNDAVRVVLMQLDKLEVQMLDLLQIRKNLKINKIESKFAQLAEAGTVNTRWLPFPNGHIQAFEINTGDMVSDLGQWFDLWFSDWVQIEDTVMGATGRDRDDSVPDVVYQYLLDGYHSARIHMNDIMAVRY